MGGESGGQPCEEAEEEEGSHRGAGAGAVLPGNPVEVRHHTTVTGRQAAGMNCH